MVRSSSSKVTRAFVIAGILAGAASASSDALASGRYGFIRPHMDGVPAVHPDGTDTQCGVTTYCGGPVISNVQIIPVYWTSGVSSSITSWAPGYLKTIASSTFLDMLSEYSTKGKTSEVCSMLVDGGTQYAGPSTPSSTNQTITRGTALAGVTITPTVTTGTNITDDNGAIGAELASQIKAGKLAAPTYDAQGYPNTIYFVFFPASYTITLQGGASCSTFGGYHFSADYDANCVGPYIPYAVLPDCGGPDTTATSHELAEAISDTNVGATKLYPGGELGWYLGPDNAAGNGPNPPSNCGEIGDVCEGAGSATVTGTSISAQLIWSQVQQGGSCQIDNSSLGVQTAPGGAPITKCITDSVDAGGGGTDGGGSGHDGGGGLVDSGSGGGGTDATIGGGTSDGGGVTVGGGGGGSPSDDAGNGGGNGATGNGSGGNGSGDGNGSSGCSCDLAHAHTSSGVDALGALLALGLLARGRRRRAA